MKAWIHDPLLGIHAAILFCRLKMLFRFSLDFDVQMLATYRRASLMIPFWYVLLWSSVKHGLIFFNGSILFGTLLARVLRWFSKVKSSSISTPWSLCHLILSICESFTAIVKSLSWCWFWITRFLNRFPMI